MFMYNVPGTSGATCACDSWLAHWEKFSGRTATYCSEKSCTNKLLVGAHVAKVYGNDNKVYIVPLCNAHNQSGKAVDIPDATPLVSANPAETCEKPIRRW